MSESIETYQSLIFVFSPLFGVLCALIAKEIPPIERVSLFLLTWNYPIILFVI
jgi:hypothetical protein